MDYHNCEFEKIRENTYCYYYGSRNNYCSMVTIKRTEAEKWRYLRMNNSSSEEFQNLQECIDAAYADMLRSKL